MGLFFSLFIGLYMFMSYTYSCVYQKAGVSNIFLAYFPILQLLPLYKIIGKSGWNVLWLFVPVVNICFVVYWTVLFFRAFRMSPWWTLLVFFTPFWFLIIIYMAYSPDVVHRTARVPVATPAVM
ncbi:hypothetical protein GCM10025857_29830 [Alicyclobacillus contaminans]|uniref:DUF5684 domain-containing protein n=1 Tax=Alicyclobacillus contaminans TaxID=392016 RepID=UPI00041A0739|nr:DUF5684 domain-containing protein [Alicyclobacillus contaminans]GMA51626.1 hypothetical protein GCM10025857_29830 [Alicyclobacillus contaminans]